MARLAQMRDMNGLAQFFSRLSLLALVGVLGFILWDRYTPPAPPATLEPIVGQIDRIVIEKAERRMVLLQDDIPVRTYQIALGFAPEGDKNLEGDGKTPEGVDPGGDIFIHGQPNRRKKPEPIMMDWTDGCIALSNTEIEELWSVTPVGTPVEIRP